MDFTEDPNFKIVTECMNEPNGTIDIQKVLDSADNVWLNKCGHAFVRHAVSIIYNRHYYTEGTSFTGGRINLNQIKDDEVGRLFVNMAYVLMAIKKDDSFVFVKANEYPAPSFDIFIEY